jgi:hypothetical protein
MSTLKGELTLSSWDEETYAEREGDRKLTRAAVTQELAGDIVGKAEVEWLMSYRADGTAHFVGLQHFQGTIDGREGSAVLESIGEFDGTEATWKGTVVEGSGSGGWEGMRGEGQFSAPHGPKAKYSLDCDFDA